MDIRFSAITAALAAAVFVSVPASAQVAIQQLGPFTTGHLPMIAGSGFLQDGGGSPGAGQAPQNQNNPGTLPTGLGIVNSGLGYCGFTNYAGTSYGSACWGFDGSGNGLIDFEGIGSVNIKINGQVFPFPGTGSGNVVGPATSTVGHLPLFANTSGTLLSDAGNIIGWTTQVHQNGGGTCYGAGANHVLCWSDQNMDLIADHSTIQTQDASIITYATIGGSATGVAGLDWTINNVLYQIRYTVQGGDTTNTIATNLAACIQNGSGAHCTITPSSPITFLQALLNFHDANGFGYKPTASNSGNSRIAFDQPWALSGNSVVAFASGGVTVTMSGGTLLDTGPYYATSRNVPNRTPVAGDVIGTIFGTGQSGATSGLDTQYTALYTNVLSPDAANPKGELVLAASDATSGKIAFQKVGVSGDGVSFFDNVDHNCGYQGIGTVIFCWQQLIYSTHAPQVLWQSNGVDFEAQLGASVTSKNVGMTFLEAGTRKFQFLKDTANNLLLFDNANGLNALKVSPAGIMTLGETGQLVISKTGAPQIGNLAQSTQATFISSGANASLVQIDTGATAQFATLQLRSNGADKWSMNNDPSNNFLLYDNGNAANVMLVTTAGNMTFGESGKNIDFASTLSVAGSPGIASCTVAVAGATITIKQGVITAFTGC